MINNEINDYINHALNDGVDLSPEEYKAKCKQADATAKANGVKGKAALTEGQRHKRIQLNFYGTVLNFMASILCEVSETNRLLREIIAKEQGNNGKQ